MAKEKKPAQIQSTMSFDVVKFENFNSTVNELRTGMFAPVEKISGASLTYKDFVSNKRKRTIATKWGDVVIKGNILTQTHRDLLDCILAVSETPVEINTRGIAYYFKLSDVLAKYGNLRKGNYVWIKQKLDEIQTTSIEFKAKDSDKYISFNILEKTGFSDVQDSFGIVFSADYREYVEQQLTISYKDDLHKLLKIESALIKAIIRFFWTHNNCNISIEQLLATLGYPIESERAIRTAKTDIRKHQEILEQDFNIFYNKKENFIYHKHTESIKFLNPIKTPPSKKEIDS